MADHNPDTHSPARGTEKDSRTVCVFCGSSPGEGESYMEVACRFGTLVGQAGFRFLFGGGRLGLMGATAVAAHQAGAKVIGIMPEFLRHLEPPLKGELEEVLLVPDLFVRKERMIALSDAFAVLPGGVGTLDELLEVVTSKQLFVHHKPIVVLNAGGYFDPMLDMIAKTVRLGFAHPRTAQLYSVAASPEEAIELLKAQLARRPAGA
jgi:uncharacterized protein (TIGR00730 family)